MRDRLAAILRSDGIDRPDETLTAFLSDPRGTAEALRPRIVAARLARGEEHLARGEVALALGAFDGVLAVEPRHPGVLAHLAVVARSDRRRRLLLRAGAVLAVLGVAGLATYGLARLAEQGRRSPAAPEPAATIPAPEASVAVLPAQPPPAAIGEPRTRPVVPEGPGPGPARPVAARKAPPPVPFTVHVRPYAQRALLDGVEVASDEQRVVYSLGPGSHRLRIEHPCCEPFEREIDAASAERLGELKVPLTPRAASLRIAGDPATRVYVGGKLLGTAAESQREPFRVRVPPDGPNPYEGELELLLEAPGRRPAGATVRVRAGQEISVPAILTEEPPR